jgi:hypothetical protein
LPVCRVEQGVYRAADLALHLQAQHVSSRAKPDSVSISLAARQYLTTTRLLISQQQFSHGRECDYVLWLVLCVVKVSELAGTFRDGTWLFLLED